MKRLVASFGVLFLLAALAAACVPPPAPPAPAPYLDPTFSNISITPKASPVTYGAAPAVDPTVGTPNDPHGRVVDANGNEVLHLWAVDPIDNAATNRPAIIWIHGGGFRGGIGSEYSLGNDVGVHWAERGYVGFSIEYRIDTTSECQYVQDHQHDVPLPPGFEELKVQCLAGIQAAQEDTQAAVRWVRRHAAEYRVDPSKVAVGGFSAGAVTAANVAYRFDLVTPRAYSADDDPTTSSRAQAALGASGCTYDPASIGVGDSPTSFIHSELDVAVDYGGCVVPTFTTARAAGLVAELTSYCDQSAHAKNLYRQTLAATDAQWSTFLARELKIYSGLRPPSADPICP